MLKKKLLSAAATLALTVGMSLPAQAEVSGLTDAGFVSRNEVTVSAAPDDAWLETVAINRWWSVTAASIRAWGTLAALPMACSQASVPSWPTGAEPTTGRPAASNSRMLAV